MKVLKISIAVAGLIGGVAILVCQQMRIDRLAAEAGMLREQIQQAESRQDPAETPKAQPSQASGAGSAAALTGEQFSELLRLRGEVGVLRAQLAEGGKRVDGAQYAGGGGPSRTNSADGFNRMLQNLNTAMAETDSSKRRKLLDLAFAAWAQHDTEAALQWVEQHLSDPGEKEAALNAIRSVAPVGIGAELAQQDGYTVVNRLFPGSPAELSGQLHSGDRIVALAQGDNVFVDARNLPLSELVKAIRGAPGTPIQLQILPAAAPADSAPVTVILRRDQIKYKNEG